MLSVTGHDLYLEDASVVQFVGTAITLESVVFMACIAHMSTKSGR